MRIDGDYDFYALALRNTDEIQMGGIWGVSNTKENAILYTMMM